MTTLPLFAALALAAGASQLPGPPATVAPGAELTEVFADGRFYEGPVWDTKSGKLYFTAFGKDNTQVMRLDEPGKATVWMDKSQGVNGLWISREGRLLGAQGVGKAVIDAAIGATGPEDLRLAAASARWVAPNDLCQVSNGNIYFTDPDFKDKKRSSVFLITPLGEVRRVVSDMAITNGVIASLDGKTLYVGDSHNLHWRAYPIHDDGSVGEGRLFFDPKVEHKGSPDGMTIDERGNLYFSGRGGVWVVSPQGEALGFIPVPEFCSNCDFGGPDGKTLYLTCQGKVYSLTMTVRGGTFVDR